MLRHHLVCYNESRHWETDIPPELSHVPQFPCPKCGAIAAIEYTMLICDICFVELKQKPGPTWYEGSLSIKRVKAENFVMADSDISNVQLCGKYCAKEWLENRKATL